MSGNRTSEQAQETARRFGLVSPDPSPLEIRASCRGIRAEWSEAEHRKRAGLPVEEPLEYKVSRAIATDRFAMERMREIEAEGKRKRS